MNKGIVSLRITNCYFERYLSLTFYFLLLIHSFLHLFFHGCLLLSYYFLASLSITFSFRALRCIISVFFLFFFIIISFLIIILIFLLKFFFSSFWCFRLRLPLLNNLLLLRLSIVLVLFFFRSLAHYRF